MRLRPAGPEDLALLQRWDAELHVQAMGGAPEFNDWDWENKLGPDECLVYKLARADWHEG